MKTSRTWGGVATLVAAWAASSSSGCASVLGLDDFTEAEAGATTGTGSSTSTGDSTATTTTSDTTSTGPGGGDGSGGAGGSSAETTGSTGGGGSGGEGGTGPLSCTLGSPFEVFSTLELGGAEIDDERLAVVSRPASNRVHVAILTGNNGDGYQVVARTMQLGAVPDLRQIVTYPEQPDGEHRRFVGAYTTSQAVHFWGIQNNRAGEFVFAGSDGIEGPATFHAYPAPPDCNDIQALSVHQDASGVARFAATCVNPNFQAYLYGGTRDTMEFVIGPVAGDGDGNAPDDLAVRAMGRVDNQYVIFTGPDGLEVGSGGFLRVGSSAAELGTARPVVPPANHGLLFHVGPTIEGRLFVSAIDADPDSFPDIDGVYRTGLFASGDAPALSEDVASVLDTAVDFGSQSEVAPFFVLQRSGQLVISAAATLAPTGAPNSVALSAWHLDGSVAVDRFIVAESTDGIVRLAAAAASGGFGAQAVAWSEVVGGAYRVRAAGVQCVAD